MYNNMQLILYSVALKQVADPIKDWSKTTSPGKHCCLCQVFTCDMLFLYSIQLFPNISS